MLLKAINNGSITSADTMICHSGILGGVLVTADGTNNCTVIVRKDGASGKQIFKVVTKSPGFFVAPISAEGTTTLYYDISGSGGAAQFFEWIT
jgi:hypothetical protein